MQLIFKALRFIAQRQFYTAAVALLSLLGMGNMASSAFAQPTTYLKVSAGTGFAINQNGQVVTNAHVVKDCQSITVGSPPNSVPASLVAEDQAHDLALLTAPTLRPSAIASLRWDIRNLTPGSAVMVIGYPGQAGMEGRYSVKKTTVLKLEGPAGEPRWIQLNHVAEHGNSGGPVLDMAGNVIGVISGVAETYRVVKDSAAPPSLVGKADVAITLSELQSFLRIHTASYYEAATITGQYSETVVEQQALRFIVPIRCIQGTVSR